MKGWEFPVEAIDASCDPYVIGPDDYAELVETATTPGARYAVAPFGVDGRAGCLVALAERDDFGERQLALLGGLAQQAKLAIANASSYESLERTFVSTVEALAKRSKRTTSTPPVTRAGLPISRYVSASSLASTNVR